MGNPIQSVNLPYPKFMRGDIEFELKPHRVFLTGKNISTFGATGLPWKPLSPDEHFGLPIMAKVHIPVPHQKDHGLSFKTRAYIMRESTINARFMGLKFLLDEATRSKVQVLINRLGHSPKDYVRKYPRIPSQKTIYTFPTRATVTSPTKFVADVLDLSPSGVLLASDNQATLEIRAGKRIDFTLEPRGWFPTPVHLDGYICRITDDLDPESGNIMRRFGIQLAQPDLKNRSAFMDLLKSILIKIQEDSA